MDADEYHIFKSKNPNLIGELLREKLFKYHNNKDCNIGCYSTFDVADEFLEIKEDLERTRITELIFGGDSDEISEIIERGHYYRNEDINAFWYWDGDGTLLFEDIRNGTVLMNNDCKKDYRWSFYKSKNGNNEE